MLPAFADPDFPAQSQFDRKERIYFDMIKHFEEGEAWSSALMAYKELQLQYEENVFDFSGHDGRRGREIGVVRLDLFHPDRRPKPPGRRAHRADTVSCPLPIPSPSLQSAPCYC